jgi:hypothetical protein
MDTFPSPPSLPILCLAARPILAVSLLRDSACVEREFRRMTGMPSLSGDVYKLIKGVLMAAAAGSVIDVWFFLGGVQVLF